MVRTLKSKKKVSGMILLKEDAKEILLPEIGNYTTPHPIYLSQIRR